MNLPSQAVGGAGFSAAGLLQVVEEGRVPREGEPQVLPGRSRAAGRGGTETRPQRPGSPTTG
jgi:hypothetical protein